ncbi:MAG: nucleoside monophosphate kinase [Patescibacteria group bacterium]|jgi:adenylate kinase|nr:nucleoside monophosphate kinase [Patescibacteria group bacterium]
MGKIICLYGLPACGKTTQAEKINEEFELIQFGMGDRLRDEIASGSTLGQKIKNYVDAGTLISDDLMKQVIENVSDKMNEKGIIFDGFPRMISQAKMLEEICSKINKDIDYFFYLKVSPDEAVRRIKARASLTGRSDDMDPQAIKNRMGVFENESKILLDYYQNKGKLVEIDGEKSIEDVYSEIRKYLA